MSLFFKHLILYDYLLIEACSTLLHILQKVPCAVVIECERAHYGLNGLQRHLMVISSSRQQTNSHQKASSPRSDKETQPSSASVQEQMTSTLLG